MDKTTRISGAVAVVTGGGSGIGRGLSIELARRGATVHVTDVNGEAAERVAREIGGSARHARLDVRDAAAVQKLVDGVGRVDLMFNNAGIGVGGEVDELTVAHWDRILDINVRGVVHGVQAVYPQMKARRDGHIVNTASLAGLTPVPLLAPYAMTKWAVVGLGESLRIEAEQFGVKVSTLCPAAIETPLLDSDNPKDLPAVKWKPDLRTYIQKLAGPAYPVEKLAKDTLDAVERGAGLIVVPGRARVAWRAFRMMPWAASGVLQSTLAKMRKERGA
jgi:NAD(P)-dependent dehydrogenase (short-subunit alcohol dehydrogenase family)